MLTLYFNGSAVSLVSIVSNCGLDNKGIVFCLPAGASFCSRKSLDPLWGPPRFLFNGLQVQTGRGFKLSTQLPLLTRVRMGGAVPASSQYLFRGVHRDGFTLAFNLTKAFHYVCSMYLCGGPR